MLHFLPFPMVVDGDEAVCFGVGEDFETRKDFKT
jgi:hypothetical protein